MISNASSTLVAYGQARMKREMELWEQGFVMWDKAFEPLFQEQDFEFATPENIAILQCYLYGLVFKTIHATCMETEECVFDNFLDRFKYIISSSQFLFQKDEEFRLLRGPVLQFGMGLIICLYYTATRCRDSILRREAIAILRRFPSKNGVWYSLQVAEVASWVADLEDDGRNEGVIAERSRVRMHTLNWAMDCGRINVECIQGIVGDGLKTQRAILTI